MWQNTTSCNIYFMLLPGMCQTHKSLPYHTYISYMWWAYMVNICWYAHKLLATAMWPAELESYFTNYNSCYWHILLKKYVWHITIIDHTLINMFWHIDPTLVHMSQSKTCSNIYFTCYCHKCTRNRHAHQIRHICHIFDYHLWGMYVHIMYIYVLYEVTGINHVTRSPVHIQWQMTMPRTIKTLNCNCMITVL